MANREKLQQRVLGAAESALYKKKYVSAIDVLIGIGFIEPVHEQNWRRGKIPFLEQAVQANLGKVSFAMKCFRNWASEKGLKPSKTAYLARSRGAKRHLRFSKSGQEDIEEAYRTHYLCPSLSDKKKKQLQDKMDKAPEIVVYHTLNDSRCSRCNKEMGRGCFLIMEGDQPLCLGCSGLGGLVFLPSGDATLTRRAKKNSAKSAVVVRYSRTRKRYERQGLLVEEKALAEAQASL